VRDDLKNLPLPKETKTYARRHGLSAMKKQPQSFIDMAAAVSGQRAKKHGFSNVDAAGKVPHAIKEAARQIVAAVLEDEQTEGYFEYQVYPDESFLRMGTDPGSMTYNIQVPVGNQIFVNKINLKVPFDETARKQIEDRMAELARTRDYPDGSFFNAPWGTYFIHGKTIKAI